MHIDFYYTYSLWMAYPNLSTVIAEPYTSVLKYPSFSTLLSLPVFSLVSFTLWRALQASQYTYEKALNTVDLLLW